MILCICPSVYSTGSGVLIKTFEVPLTKSSREINLDGRTDVSGHGGDVKPAGLHKVGGGQGLIMAFTGNPVRNLSAYAGKTRKNNHL